MSRKYGKNLFNGVALAATLGFVALPARADGDAPAAKPSSTLNLAGLTAALQAASNRKQTGPEVTLKKDAYLHTRPTGPAMRSNMLPAGTVLHKSKIQIVNASGAWHHVETNDGKDGWMYDLDLDP